MGGPSLGLLTVLPTKNQNIHEVLEGYIAHGGTETILAAEAP